MSKSLRKVISSLTALAMGLNFLLVQIPTASAEYTLLGKSLKSTWKLNSGEEDASDLSAKSELAFSSSSDIYSVTMKNTESDGGSDASISVTLSENEDDSVFVLTGGGETVEVSKDNGVATYSVGVKNTDLTPLTKYYSANLVIKDKNGSDAHTVALVYGNPLAYSGEIATEAGTGSVTLSAPGKPVSINVTNSTAIEQKIKVTVDEGTNKTGISADGTNVSESISGLFKITSDSDEVLSEDTLTVSSDGSSFKVSLDGSKVGKNGTYLGTINVDSENDAYDFSFTVKAVVEYRAMDIAGLANNLTAFLPASGNRTQFNYGGNNTEKLYGFDGYVPLANGFSVYGDFTSGTVYDNWISVDANSDGTNMPNINTQGGGNANRRNIKIDGLLDGDQIVVVGGSGSVTHSLGTTAGGEELVTKANGGLGTTGATKALVTYNVNQNADSVYFTTAGSVRIYEVYVLSGTVYTDNKGNLTSITQFTKDIGAAKAVTSQKIADTSGTTGVIAAGVTKTGNGQFTFNSAEDARGLIDLTGVLTHSGNTKTRVIYSVSSAGDTGATFTGWSRTAGGGTLTEKGEINPNAFLVTSAGTATIKGTVVNSGTNYANYSEEFDITILAATVPEADVKVTADQGWTNSDGETKAKIELSGKEGAIEAFSTVSVTNSGGADSGEIVAALSSGANFTLESIEGFALTTEESKVSLTATSISSSGTAKFKVVPNTDLTSSGAEGGVYKDTITITGFGVIDVTMTVTSSGGTTEEWPENLSLNIGNGLESSSGDELDYTLDLGEGVEGKYDNKFNLVITNDTGSAVGPITVGADSDIFKLTYENDEGGGSKAMSTVTISNIDNGQTATVEIAPAAGLTASSGVGGLVTGNIILDLGNEVTQTIGASFKVLEDEGAEPTTISVGTPAVYRETYDLTPSNVNSANSTSVALQTTIGTNKLNLGDNIYLSEGANGYQFYAPAGGASITVAADASKGYSGGIYTGAIQLRGSNGSSYAVNSRFVISDVKAGDSIVVVWRPNGNARTLNLGYSTTPDAAANAITTHTNLVAPGGTNVLVNKFDVEVAGEYYLCATGGNGTQIYEIIVSHPAGEALTSSAGAVSFAAVSEDADYAVETKEYAITNTGGNSSGTLTITSSEDYMKVDPSTVSIAAGESATFKISTSSGVRSGNNPEKNSTITISGATIDNFVINTTWTVNKAERKSDALTFVDGENGTSKVFGPYVAGTTSIEDAVTITLTNTDEYNDTNELSVTQSSGNTAFVIDTSEIEAINKKTISEGASKTITVKPDLSSNGNSAGEYIGWIKVKDSVTEEEETYNFSYVIEAADKDYSVNLSGGATMEKTEGDGNVNEGNSSGLFKINAILKITAPEFDITNANTGNYLVFDRWDGEATWYGETSAGDRIAQIQIASSTGDISLTPKYRDTFVNATAISLAQREFKNPTDGKMNLSAKVTGAGGATANYEGIEWSLVPEKTTAPGASLSSSGELTVTGSGTVVVTAKASKSTNYGNSDFNQATQLYLTVYDMEGYKPVYEWTVAGKTLVSGNDIYVMTNDLSYESGISAQMFRSSSLINEDGTSNAFILENDPNSSGDNESYDRRLATNGTGSATNRAFQISGIKENDIVELVFSIGGVDRTLNLNNNSTEVYTPGLSTRPMSIYTRKVTSGENTYVFYDNSGGTNVVRLTVKRAAFEVKYVDSNSSGYAEAHNAIVFNELYTTPEKPIAEGHVFRGWAMTSESDGELVQAASEINLSAHAVDGVVTFTAVWESALTISYNSSGANSGGAPTVDSNSYYAGQLNVQISGNTSNLAKSGYNMVGWTEEASKVDLEESEYYKIGSFITMPNHSITLYPVWEIKDYSYSFNPKAVVFGDYSTTSSSGRSVEVSVAQTGTNSAGEITYSVDWKGKSEWFSLSKDALSLSSGGDSFNITTSTGSEMAGKGFSDGEELVASISFSSGALDKGEKLEYIEINTVEVTLTVVNAVTSTLTVTGSSGEPAARPGDIREGAVIGIPLEIKEHYTFTGWSFTSTGAETGAEIAFKQNSDGELQSAASSAGASYDNLYILMPGYALTVTANYEPTTYSIIYHANRGADDDATRSSGGTIVDDSGLAIPETPFDWTYENMKFNGWNSQSDGEGTSYTAGAKVLENVDIYATWVEKSEASIALSMGDDIESIVGKNIDLGIFEFDYDKVEEFSIKVSNEGEKDLINVVYATSSAGDFILSSSGTALIAGENSDAFTVKAAIKPNKGTETVKYTGTVTVSSGDISKQFNVFYTVNPEPLYTVKVSNGTITKVNGVDNTADDKTTGSYTKGTLLTLSASSGDPSLTEWKGWVLTGLGTSSGIDALVLDVTVSGTGAATAVATFAGKSSFDLPEPPDGKRWQTEIWDISTKQDNTAFKTNHIPLGFWDEYFSEWDSDPNRLGQPNIVRDGGSAIAIALEGDAVLYRNSGDRFAFFGMNGEQSVHSRVSANLAGDNKIFADGYVADASGYVSNGGPTQTRGSLRVTAKAGDIITAYASTNSVDKTNLIISKESTSVALAVAPMQSGVGKTDRAMAQFKVVDDGNYLIWFGGDTAASVGETVATAATTVRPLLIRVTKAVLVDTSSAKWNVAYSSGNEVWDNENAASDLDESAAGAYVLKTPSKAGYNFDYWQVNGDGEYKAGSAVDLSVLEADGGGVTFTAVWSAKDFAFTASPTSVDFGLVSRGGSRVATSVITLNRGADDPGELTVSINADWATVEPQTVEFSNEGTATFTIYTSSELANSSGSSSGVNNASVTISSEELKAGDETKSFTAEVNVIIDITDEVIVIGPVFEVSSDEGPVASDGSSIFDFGSEEEGYKPITSKVLTIKNTGDQPFDGINIESSSAGFMFSATSSTGIAANGGSWSFTVFPSNDLDPGVYESIVTISSGEQEFKFNVKFEVTAKAPPRTQFVDVWNAADYVSVNPYLTSSQAGTEVVLVESIRINHYSGDRTVDARSATIVNAADESLSLTHALNQGGNTNLSTPGFIGRAIVVREVQSGDMLDVVFFNGTSANSNELWYYVDETGDGPDYSNAADLTSKSTSADKITSGTILKYQSKYVSKAGDYYFFTTPGGEAARPMYVRHSRGDSTAPSNVAISYTASGKSGVTAPSSSGVLTGDEVFSYTLTSIDSEGFLGWTVNNGGLVNSREEIKLAGQTLTEAGLIGTGDELTLNAVWGYKVAYDAGGAEGEAPTDESYYFVGEQVEVAAAGEMTSAGYKFAGWTASSSGTGAVYVNGGAKYPMANGGATLYAKWMPLEYTFTAAPLSINLGTISTIESNSSSGNVELTMGVDDPGLLNVSIDVPWAKVDPASVSFDSNGKATFTISTDSAIALASGSSGSLTGNVVVSSAPVKVGSADSAPVTAEVTVLINIIHAAARDLNVTASSGGALGEDSSESGVYAVGSDIKLSAVPDKHYNFSRWETNSAGLSLGLDLNSSELEFKMPEENVEFTAIFTPVEYTITYYAADGITASSVVYTVETEDLTFPTGLTVEGKTFTGWALTAAGSVEYTAGMAINIDLLDANDPLKLYSKYRSENIVNQIEVWDFGNKQETGADYQNWLPLNWWASQSDRPWNASSTNAWPSGNTSIDMPGGAKFYFHRGDRLSYYNAAGTQVYSVYPEPGTGTPTDSGADANNRVFVFEDGYTTQASYNINNAAWGFHGADVDSGASAIRHRGVFEVSASSGDVLTAYVGLGGNVGTTESFVLANTETRTVLQSKAVLQNMTNPRQGTKAVFIVPEDGRYVLTFNANGTVGAPLVIGNSAMRPNFIRITKSHAVSVSGKLDFTAVSEMPVSYDFKFVEDETGYEYFAEVDEQGNYEVSLPYGRTFTAGLDAVGNYGYRVAESSLSLQTTVDNLYDPITNHGVNVEQFDLAYVSGEIIGLADGYLNGKELKLFLEGGALPIEAAVSVTERGVTYSAGVEKDFQYQIVLEGINDYEIVTPEDGIISFTGSGDDYDITLNAKTIYPVTGNFLLLQDGTLGKYLTLSEDTVSDMPENTITGLTFKRIGDGYTYNAAVTASGYSISLMPGAYEITAVPTAYRTRTHAVIGDDGNIVVGGESTGAKERDLLFTATTTPASVDRISEITVAKDGSGMFNTVQEAVNYAMRINNPTTSGYSSNRINIVIKPGVYREKLYVNAPFISLKNAEGSSGGEVKITWYQAIGYEYYSGDGGYYDAELAYDKYDKGIVNTRWAATVFLTGNADKFRAENIVFENSFNREMTQEELDDGVASASSMPERTNMEYNVLARSARERAAALAIDGASDVEFMNCEFLSSQDTIYTGTQKAYFKGGKVEGTVDFIAGGGNLFFEGTAIGLYGESDTATAGYITAPQSGKYVFYNSAIAKTTSEGVQVGSYYYGRPWAVSGSDVLFYNAELESENIIQAAGWSDWATGDGSALQSSFREYGTTVGGTAIDPSGRLTGKWLSEDPWTGDLASERLSFYSGWLPFYAGGADTEPPLPPSGRLDVWDFGAYQAQDDADYIYTNHIPYDYWSNAMTTNSLGEKYPLVFDSAKQITIPPTAGALNSSGKVVIDDVLTLNFRGNDRLRWYGEPGIVSSESHASRTEIFEFTEDGSIYESEGYWNINGDPSLTSEAGSIVFKANQGDKISLYVSDARLPSDGTANAHGMRIQMTNAADDITAATTEPLQVIDIGPVNEDLGGNYRSGHIATFYATESDGTSYRFNFGKYGGAANTDTSVNGTRPIVLRVTREEGELAPVVTTDKTALDFGSRAANYSMPSGQVVNVSNTGSIDTGEIFLTVTGDKDAFTATPAPASLLTSGLTPRGKGSLTIRPVEALALGEYNATFTIGNSAGGFKEISAKFVVTAEPTYKLTLVKGSITSDDKGGIYLAGTEVKVVANKPDAGQKFKQWEATSAGAPVAVSTEAEMAYTMPAYNVTLQAVYENETYELTVVGGTIIKGGSGSSGSFNSGSEISIKPDQAPEGKLFSGWTFVPTISGASELGDGTVNFLMPTSNLTVTANFVNIPTFTATFKVNALSGAAPADISALSGTEITLPDAGDYTGYEFMGWTAGGKTYAAGAKHILNANTTFEAYYENTEPGTPTDKLDVWSSMDYEVDDVPLGSTLPNWTQGQLKPTIYLNKDSANRTIRLYTSESPVSFTNAAGEAIGPFEKELNMGGAANVENDNFIARAMVIKGVKPGDTIDVVYRNGNSADGGLWMYVDKTGEGTKFTSGAKDAIKAYSTEVVPYTDGSPKHYQVLGTATEAGDYYFFSFSNTQWMYVRHSYVDPGLYTATVTYNANGGEGAPDPQTSAERSAWPVSITLSSGAPSRTDGYEFAGWALSATATAAEVQPGDLVSFSRENVTYYAVWSPTNVMVGEIAGALDIGDFEEGYSINDVDSKAKTITVTNLGVASAFEIVSTTSTSSNFSVTPGLFDLKANVNNNVNDSCVITIKPVLGLGNGTYTETFNVVVADEVRGTFTASFKVFGKEQPKATYELWAGEGASVPGIIETGIRSVDSTVTIDSAILPAGTGDMNFTGWTITKADGSEVDFTYDERAEIITFTMPNYDIVITANYNAHLWSRGDVNRDGEIGNADALWLKRYLLELPGYDEFREEMDMNGNGEIGNDDALWLVRHLLELPGYEVIMPW